MKKRKYFENRLNRRSKLPIILFIWLLFPIFFTPNAVADPLVTVKVLIERASWEDCRDIGPPDIYFEVVIDGIEHTSENDPIESNFSPFEVGKEFSQDVDVTNRFIPIIIRQLDADSIGDDDVCDISANGTALNLTLDLLTCQISGELDGLCDTTILGDGDNMPQISISLEEPPQVEGISVRCLHDPIWPQAGDTVTIVAEALDGGGVPRTGIVDDIEIWVQDTDSPSDTTATTPGSFGANTFSYTHTPASGDDQILYRCRIIDDGSTVSSGWRITQIGEPEYGRAVPVIYTGVSDSRIDIVFIADEDDYLGATDTQFLADVHTVIQDAYYNAHPFFNGGLPFLFNQDHINFWIALDTGDAVPYCETCFHEPPSGWDSTYSFADSGAIIHSTNFRDSALPNRRIFSSVPTNAATILHETGHSPFGLADEYCCDGAYFQANSYPNIYSNQLSCLNDSLAIGVFDACQQITDGTNTVDWFRVDPQSTIDNDVMLRSGDATAQPADERRIEWLFDICENAGC